MRDRAYEEFIHNRHFICDYCGDVYDLEGYSKKYKHMCCVIHLREMFDIKEKMKWWKNNHVNS